MLNKYKIFFPSTIKDLFYFYISYDRFVQQTIEDQQKDYYEPTTGLKGEIDQEYFQLMF